MFFLKNFVMENKLIYNYFLFLFSIIPLSFLIGPAFSLSAIIIIDISFLIYLFFQKEFFFFKNETFKYFLILYAYLIINLLVSIDSNIGIYRNLGFLRVIIFFVAINYFFFEKKFLNKVFLVWSTTLMVVVFDVFIESIFGKNIFGYGGLYGGKGGSRIVSFFKNEPIVGAYLFGFYLIFLGYFLDKFGTKNKYIIFLFGVVFLLSIILTGERSNGIKAILGFFLLILFYKNINFKYKIGIFISFIVFFIFFVSNSNFLKFRYTSQLKTFLNTDNIYINLYKSGYQVFKNNPILGVGNKNYRIETCQENINKQKNKSKYVCQTHPHQIYLELLSEHGLIGFILIFYILYKLIFSKIKEVLSGSNYVQIGSLIYMLLTFLPGLPSGAFFGDFTITLFLINLSIFYASDLKINLFNYKNYNKLNNK